MDGCTDYIRAFLGALYFERYHGIFPFAVMTACCNESLVYYAFLIRFVHVRRKEQVKSPSEAMDELVTAIPITESHLAILLPQHRPSHITRTKNYRHRASTRTPVPAARFGVQRQ